MSRSFRTFAFALRVARVAAHRGERFARRTREQLVYLEAELALRDLERVVISSAHSKSMSAASHSREV